MFLNEVMVKKPEEDSDVFHLSHIDRVYNLRCHSQNDRYTLLKTYMHLGAFLDPYEAKI